jgi:CheY-like chemotaxis protein
VVVDDSQVLLDGIRQSLERAGYRVNVTTQTVGAARLLVGAALVIIDWHMPGINGGGVLDSFRAASANLAQIPEFYLYTSDPTVASNAHRYGFNGAFLNKGDYDSLVHQVAAALRIAKLKSRAARARPQ